MNEQYKKVQNIFLPPYKKSDIFIALVILLLLLTLPVITIISSRNANVSTKAAGSAAFEIENGTIAGNVAVVNDTNASNGKYVLLGSVPATQAAMPVGDKPGWKQIATDDFNGTTLTSFWGKYSGNIPSMPGGVWDPARVEVKDGKLRLLAANRGDGVWTSGGVAWANNNTPAKRTFAKYEMRMRMDKANGVKYAALTWPSGGNWPVDGEIDFAEDGGGQRTGTSGTTHYAAADGTGHYIVQRHVDVDMSQWQNIGVEWTPGKIVYTLNGQPWGEVTSPPAAIPDGPMFFAIQTEANTQGATQWMTTVDATTPPLVALEVDWIVAYAPN